MLKLVSRDNLRIRSHEDDLPSQCSERGRLTVFDTYLILVIVLGQAQLHARLVQAEDVAVPVLYLIERFSAERETRDAE